MNIIEAMKADDSRLRISHKDRWLIWDATDGWVVYEKAYRRGVLIVYTGTDEAAAVAALIGDDEQQEGQS
jgi:hypothetical protein